MASRTLLALLFAATPLACGGEGSIAGKSDDVVRAAKDRLVVDASAKTRAAFGIETWGVDDSDTSLTVVRGYDKSGVAVVRFDRETVLGARRTFSATLEHDGRKATLKIRPVEDDQLRIEKNGFVDDADALSVLEHMTADLKNIGESSSLHTKSIRPLNNQSSLRSGTDGAEGECLTATCGTSLLSSTIGTGSQTTLTCAHQPTGTAVSKDSDCGSSVRASGEAGDAQVNGCGCGRSDAVARAREWVAAKMPYCGGVNGGSDAICGGTCSRSGEAKKPEWDEYRSDCSGLVSYAWGLPAPGRTTSTLAPYDTSASEATTFEKLMPGDAFNNDHHVMLFGGWSDQAKGMAIIIEEYDCGQLAREAESSVQKQGDSTVLVHGETFNAIKYKASNK